MFAYCFVPFRPFCRTEFRRERKLALNQLLHCFYPSCSNQETASGACERARGQMYGREHNWGLVGRRCMKARPTTLVVAAAVSVARVSWIRLLGRTRKPGARRCRARLGCTLNIICMIGILIIHQI